MGKKYTLKQLAEYLDAEFEGNGEKQVSGVADLQKATSEELSFLAKKQFDSYLQTSRAGILVVKPGIAVPAQSNVIRVDDPYLAYAKLTGLFVDRQPAPAGIHPSAVVHASAVIAPSASIGPNCVIDAGVTIGDSTELQCGILVGKNSRIGKDCTIYANVSIYHGVTIGDRVTLHSATVIGADGFGFAPSPEGWIKIHQLGGVVIGNDVEIGAGTAIDRGAINDTCIGNGIIIDNNVHIAHNVIIGDRTAIAGCVGIAGSSTIGEDCTIGGFAAINGHVQIADNVHLHGATIVTRSITEAGSYASCTPVQEVRKWRRNTVRFTQLDEWVERIKKLEQADE